MLRAREIGIGLSICITILSQPPVLPAGETGTASPPGAGGSSAAAMTVSSVFKNGQVIPKQFTADGANISPPLNWTEPPTETKSITVLCLDPDAPGGAWYHWLVYNLSPRIKSLPQAVPKQTTISNGGKQGVNDFNQVGYNGPAPPPGAKHRYYFQVLAVDTMLSLGQKPHKQEILKALAGHVVAQSELVGLYR